MKRLVVVFTACLLVAVASCTQRTCPTYTKGAPEAPQQEHVEGSDVQVKS
jgi:hypothetical protein